MRSALLTFTLSAALLVVTGCEGGGAAAGAAPAVIPSTQPAPGEPVGKVTKTDAEWRQQLSANQYYVLREKGTEPPFRNAYNANKAAGTYLCAGCGLEVFRGSEKFDSGTGWPSFYDAAAKGRVHVGKDADGQRDELTCERCGGHL
ncbi:MAG TPA: peptide-methionine (R)-S-oxide reductase, partial [Tepidisphaeraceae bacterium]|nr:peptide-methionine (R)-S-oxide reductase [Tepidisphaeraceae bacterium]